jgi:hypothetical protein
MVSGRGGGRSQKISAELQDWWGLWILFHPSTPIQESEVDQGHSPCCHRDPRTPWMWMWATVQVKAGREEESDV